MPRIVFSGPPRPELVLELVGNTGSQGRDRPNIQVEVRPAVAANADTRRKRIVDGRMAERAGDTNALDSIASNLGDDTDDRVLFQQLASDAWIVEVELPCRERLDDRRRQRLRIDLEADG